MGEYCSADYLNRDGTSAGIGIDQVVEAISNIFGLSFINVDAGFVFINTLW